MKNLKFLMWITLLCISTTCESRNNIDDFEDYTLLISVSSDQHAAYSPDGSIIAYIHKDFEFPQSQDYPTGLYVMNSDGSNRRLLYNGSHMHPTWSPDGEWLAISTEGVIQVLNLDGDSIRTCGLFTDPMFAPDWSPNGTQIIFSTPMGNSGIYVSDPEFLSGRKFFETKDYGGMDPSWGPSNDKVIYCKPSLKGEELFYFDTVARSEIQITNNHKLNRDPNWTPDGKLITWNRSNYVLIAEYSGLNEKTLAAGRFPSWSRDSKSIIFSGPSIDFKKEVIWRINIDGLNKIQLTN